MLVYVHEIKEVLIEILIIIGRLSTNFMSEGGISPFFWLANKITEIINKQQADGVL